MLRNLLLLAASLVFALLLSEAVLRAAGYASPSFYGPDPETGFALRPGAAGWWRSEGEAYIDINSHGQRDRPHSLEKPSGTIRIAVLGDSYAEAMQVPIEETFWGVAEAGLNRSCRALDGQTAEFINFGVAGYGTAQELLTLRHRALGFDPDFVLLAFFAGNDVRNNSRKLEGDLMRPYFELSEGELTLDDAFRQSRGFRFRTGGLGRLVYATLNYSRTGQLANSARYRIRLMRQEARREAAQESGISEATYRPPTTDEWRNAWTVTDALIRRMGEEVRDYGARFLVMTLSVGAQVLPDPDAREEAARQLGLPDLDYPNRRVQAVAAEAGAQTIPTVPALRDWAESSGECVHGFDNAIPCGGHWNAEGHRIAGERVAEVICRSLRSDGSSPSVRDLSPARSEPATLAAHLRRAASPTGNPPSVFQSEGQN